MTHPLCLAHLSVQELSPPRVVEVAGDRVTCEFTQPLHPAVLERVLAAGQA